MQQPIRVLYRFLRKFFGKVDFQDSSKKYLFSRLIFSLLKRDGHQTSFDLKLPLILSYICFSFSIFLTFTLSDFLSLALLLSPSLFLCLLLPLVNKKPRHIFTQTFASRDVHPNFPSPLLSALRICSMHFLY